MQENECLEDFWDLMKILKQLDDESLNPESTLEKILVLVTQHPDYRTAFADGFVRVVYDSSWSIPEVTEYCMHALRWEEVKRVLEVRNSVALTGREQFYIQRVLRAFSDDWESAGMYKRFREAMH